jgi:hypothetical protein
VWEAWLADHPTVRILKPRRRNRIVWALSRYPVDVVVAAVRGVNNSPWHMGRNPHARKYNDVALILRDAKHIEWFSTLNETGLPVSPAAKLPEPEVWSEDDVVDGEIHEGDNDVASFDPNVVAYVDGVAVVDEIFELVPESAW